MKLKTKFQDEDFELGEVIDVTIATRPDGGFILRGEAKAGGSMTFSYKSLKELYENWEDVPEPNGYWYIDFDGDICGEAVPFDKETNQKRKEIGNEFETEEETEQAVEKLKAWQRLKDKGFKFVEHQIQGITADGEGNGCAYFEFDKPLGESDLDLLFGGEE